MTSGIFYSKAALDEQFAAQAVALSIVRTQYGFNFITSYTGQTPTNATVDDSLGYRLLLTNGAPVKAMLVFHAYPNSTGILQNVQFGNFNNGTVTTPSLTSVVDHAVASLLAAGVTIEAIKLHTPSGFSPSDYASGASQFWADYQAIAVALATKYQSTGIVRFAVTNEFPNGTTNSTYATQYLALINAVKAKGFAVGIAANHPDELARNTQIANLNWLGLNVYPCIGYKGSATTSEDVVAGLERYGLFQTIADYRRLYPLKPFAVTEIGTPDTWESLGSPGTFGYSDTYSRVSGAAKNVFWQGVLDAFNKWQPDAELFAWDDGRYSPYVDSYNNNAQYPTVLATMKARTVFA